MNINEQILSDAKAFVKQQFKENLPETIVYHGYRHTLDVVQHARDIAAYENLDKNLLPVLEIAAWFHDTGYIKTCDGHEEESVVFAKAFLKKKQVDEIEIEMVTKAIRATKMPQDPKHEIEKILCDADLMHLASEKYFETAELLRKEWLNTHDQKISKSKMLENSLAFFREHQFHTNYGKEILQPLKDKNYGLIDKCIVEIKKKKAVSEENLNAKIKKLDKKLAKKKGYSRGVESMFRLTARNQSNLSSMADSKSNILISVNAIIISIVFSVLVSKFDHLPNLVIPTLIFLAFSLTTIVISILSTRPNISSGRFDKNALLEHKVNLLFFGNFYNMEYEDYEWALQEMMKDDEYLYAAMIKDQYSLGKVLARKYKLLRFAYSVFMYGIIISSIAFVISYLV
jgi:predicted metal-dependent HD superfamily phosphohydrolase